MATATAGLKVLLHSAVHLLSESGAIGRDVDDGGGDSRLGLRGCCCWAQVSC
jgi:hypothetical protein